MSEDQSVNLQTAIWGLSQPLQSQDASRRTLELFIESPHLYEFLTKFDEKTITPSVKSHQSNGLRRRWIRLRLKNGTYPVKALIRRQNILFASRSSADYPTSIYVVDEKASQNGKPVYHKGGPDDLVRNSKCMVMVETVGLWFMSRQFGMSLTASEILVWPAMWVSGIDAFTLSNDTPHANYRTCLCCTNS